MSSKSIDEWKSKLVGKILVRSKDISTVSEVDKDKVVLETDLPEVKRIVNKGMLVTMDWKPERLNVHLNEDNKITSVNYG
ncbi:6985_t:CDS:2 [Diversispora eburnea]|uniref:6985_t:CDS:1 n=1 Tax=Diversispora eburnea TaxID=1213867 RepID=A0A9N9G2A4_9GLOM|nr:6985_t:CDS:2 [Diversispora eburnea]